MTDEATTALATQKTDLSRDVRSPASGFTPNEVALIKRTIAKGTTDEELSLFLQVCKQRKLNPFTRQIHCVKRWDGKEKREVMTIQTGIDGYRSLADDTGKYLGQDAPEWCGPDIVWSELWTDDVTPPFAARVRVYRQGFDRPSVGIARWDAYVQTTKDGDANSMWRKMGPEQLAKCAEALALRKAFPEKLGGLVTDDEMHQADNDRDAVETMSRVMNADDLAAANLTPEEAQRVIDTFGDDAHAPPPPIEDGEFTEKPDNAPTSAPSPVAATKTRANDWSAATKALGRLHAQAKEWGLDHDEVKLALGVEHLADFDGSLDDALLKLAPKPVAGESAPARTPTPVAPTAARTVATQYDTTLNGTEFVSQMSLPDRQRAIAEARKLFPQARVINSEQIKHGYSYLVSVGEWDQPPSAAPSMFDEQPT